jgi:hypothetical protein
LINNLKQHSLHINFIFAKKTSKMKTKSLILFVFLSVSFFSCKEEKKPEENTNTEVKNVDTKFKVSFELEAINDDNFHLYYTEDGSIKFTEEKSLWYPYKGSDKPQEVVFSLPEDAIPTNLRVDFGHDVNKEQTEIVLKKFKMNYYDKSFEAKDSLIYYYFYPNQESTILDKKTSTLKRIKLDQNSPPILYPHETLSQEIDKLVK